MFSRIILSPHQVCYGHAFEKKLQKKGPKLQLGYVYTKCYELENFIQRIVGCRFRIASFDKKSCDKTIPKVLTSKLLSRPAITQHESVYAYTFYILTRCTSTLYKNRFVFSFNISAVSQSPRKSMSYQSIFEAASNNDLAAVKTFIEVHRTKPNAVNDVGDTVAHIAAQNDNVEMLKYVLEKDANLLTARGQEDASLLEIAIAIDSLSLVKYLTDECKVDVLELHCDEPPPDTYVHFAAEMGSLEVFKYFIEEKNVTINLRNKWEQPLAFAAARKSQLHIIKYIVEERRGDVTATDTLRRNILSQSAEESDLTVPRYLLDEKKQKINVNNAYVLQDAITNAEKESDKLNEFLKYFVEEKRMSINMNKDATPLHRAASLGMANVVKYLVSHGADPRRQDWLGRTAAQVATDEEVIKYLSEEKRTRRNLPSVSRTVPALLSPSDPKIWARGTLTGPRDYPTSINRPCTDSGNFRDFLFLGIACVESKRREHVTLSPQDTLNERIDPEAVRAVHDYLVVK